MREKLARFYSGLCCFTETREVMKLTKRGFGSYFDVLQFGYAMYTLS